jgi:regulator of telomere elongation helicase 1
VKIVSQGPDRVPLHSNFLNRENVEYINSLGLTVKEVAAKTPNGVLVFFTSYDSMNETKKEWEKTGMWQAIGDVKKIFIEPKDKQTFEETMPEYYRAVNSPKGAIFMAVLRGKVSEGLDFKNQNGRAVIIAGIPFPLFKDPWVMLKRQYMDTNGNREVTGLQWYNTQAMRAVNQAIGRVIRHKNDYGAILLCDRRFHIYKDGLSKWIRGGLPHSQDENFNFDSMIQELEGFFTSSARDFPLPVEEIGDDVQGIEENRGRGENLIETRMETAVAATKRTNLSRHFGTENKKPKLETIPEVMFVSTTNSVLVRREDFAKYVPENREEFQNLVRTVNSIFEESSPNLPQIKESFEKPDYKALLEATCNYKRDRRFTIFSGALLPMFKRCKTKVYILRGLRRFLHQDHKLRFDEMMATHFIVVDQARSSDRELSRI